MFGSTFARFKQLAFSFDRMRKVMRDAPVEDLVAHSPIYMDGDVPPVPQPRPADRLEHLEVRDLTFSHPDSGRGIEGVSLSLECGTFTVVTGRIGSGKTTFLRALLGLLHKDRGQILWNGKLINENLPMGLPEEGVDLDTAIRAAVLEEDLGDLDDGLDTMIGPKGLRLSGGQMQRTAAARMFAGTGVVRL